MVLLTPMDALPRHQYPTLPRIYQLNALTTCQTWLNKSPIPRVIPLILAILDFLAEPWYGLTQGSIHSKPELAPPKDHRAVSYAQCRCDAETDRKAREAGSRQLAGHGDWRRQLGSRDADDNKIRMTHIAN